MFTKKEQILLNHLPRGWHSKASCHFEGKVSAATISRIRNNEKKDPEPEVVLFLLRMARRNKKQKERMRELRNAR